MWVDDSTKIRKASTQRVLYKILQHLSIARNCTIPLKNKNNQISGTKCIDLKNLHELTLSLYTVWGYIHLELSVTFPHYEGYSKNHEFNYV